MPLPKTSKFATGKLGEDFACKFLKSSGYQIIERNFKKGPGDIDIVTLENKTLVFVEVKTRFGDSYGTPEEAITPYKRRHLIKSAYFYKHMHPELPESLRIDVICIYLNPDNNLEKINLYKNITQ